MGIGPGPDPYQRTGAVYYISPGVSQWELRLVSDDSLVQSQDFIICNGTTDLFSSTYTITDDASIIPPFTVTRVSDCRWTGTSADGDTWFLEYNNIVFPYGWLIFSLAHPTASKVPPQNEPSGQYGTMGSGYVVS